MENELISTRRKIRRVGKILHILCRIGKIVLIFLIVAQLVVIAAVLFSEGAAEELSAELENSFSLRILGMVIETDRLSPVLKVLIGCSQTLLVCAALYALIRFFEPVMALLAEGRRPFDSDIAVKLRKMAFFFLAVAVFNLPLGGISFLLMLLFSYIMEYGAYIQKRADETNHIQEEIILSFAEITENKSGQTGQHIKRVSEYSRVIAEQLGLPEDRVENIRIASTMHDIGKLLIPSEILEKPGRLTNEEYAVIKTHTSMGGKLLEHVEGEEMQLSRTIALQHHERYDGQGYPEQMKQDAISLDGRIVAVADVYDALTSKRAYKDA